MVVVIGSTAFDLVCILILFGWTLGSTMINTRHKSAISSLLRRFLSIASCWWLRSRSLLSGSIVLELFLTCLDCKNVQEMLMFSALYKVIIIFLNQVVFLIHLKVQLFNSLHQLQLCISLFTNFIYKLLCMLLRLIQRCLKSLLALDQLRLCFFKFFLLHHDVFFEAFCLFLFLVDPNIIHQNLSRVLNEHFRRFFLISADAKVFNCLWSLSS